MKRKPNSAEPVDRAGAADLTRTTVFLSKAVDQNLEALSLTLGQSKGLLVRQALAEFLEKRGLKPHQMPKVRISY